jgi:alkanesulfonate monooxygenase SsuD/methylene tetrahydromethanopterin reductase-like flavin-dependent oxidoreductase (luciferase family)
MGGGAEAVIERIAKIADGWFPQFQPGPQGAETVERLRGFIRAADRDIDAVGIEGRISLYNTPEGSWGGAVQGWRDLGATHVSVNTMNAGLATPQDHIDAIRRFREQAASA